MSTEEEVRLDEHVRSGPAHLQLPLNFDDRVFTGTFTLTVKNLTVTGAGIGMRVNGVAASIRNSVLRGAGSYGVYVLSAPGHCSDGSYRT
jgi:hypothetical protein